MHGTTRMPRRSSPHAPEIVFLTPEKATQMLELNKQNRPMSDAHVKRIATQIKEERWRFNGDSIKVATNGDILDGQHRCWAVIEAQMPVETVIVYGIERDAFATIDTICKQRSFGDTVALNGQTRYRNVIGSALAWLVRWQSGQIEQYKQPANKVENADIEDAFKKNPRIVQAVEKAMKLRSVANPSLLAFLYYIAVDRNEALAERFVEVLTDPAGVRVSDPFFRLRAYFTTNHHQRKDPLVSIALGIKAMNATSKGEPVTTLNWRQQGKYAETFPKLKLDKRML